MVRIYLIYLFQLCFGIKGGEKLLDVFQKEDANKKIILEVFKLSTY